MNMETKGVELRIRYRFEGRKSLTEITDQLDKLATVQEKQASDAGKGVANVKELETTYQKLERTLRTVAAAFSESRQYEKQTAALTTLQQRLDTAKAKQEAFVNSLTKGADLTEKQVNQQLRLGVAVDRAGTALERARARLDASAGRLKEYGVDTGKIADAQANMSTMILRGNVALKAQEDAIDRVATSGKRFAGSGVPDALERIKLQLVGMAAAYVSVHQAASLAGGAVSAYSSREGVKNQLGLSVGNDRALIDAEYEYVKAQADRIGIEFDRAAKGYAKFAAAASMAGRTREEIRYIWEAFAEVGRVANLSADDLDGVFKAIEQITSKGKIQAEELRGQLGDRLFGAFQVAAKALKDTYPDLDKAMKNGEINATQLVAIAEEYRRTVADQLPGAMQSLSAEQARLNNAVIGFKLAIADAGFADAFRKAIIQITEALKSEDGKKFAEGLAAGFSAAADAAVWLLKNADEVLIVLKALAGMYALNTAGKAAAGLVDFAGGLKTLAADGKLAIKELGLIRGAFLLMQSALVGWSIGTWAADEFEVVRKAGIALVTGLEEAWTRIKAGAKIAWEEVPRYAKNAMVGMLNTLTWGTRQMLEILQKGLQAIGREDLAANVGKMLDKLTGKYDEQAERVAEIRAQMQRDIEQIRDIGQQMWSDAERKPKPTTEKQPTAQTERPTSTPPGKTAPTDGEIAKRQHLIDEITRSLEAIDTKLDRSQTDSLRSQLDAIDSQYAALTRKIGGLGGAAGKEFTARLDAALNQLRAQTIAKFNDGLAAESAALMAKLDAVDSATGRAQKTNLDARLAAVRTQYESTYREIEAFRLKLDKNGMSTGDADTAKLRLDAGVAELQQIDTQRYYRDELKRLEGEINNLLATRSDRLKTIADQETASLITSAEARAQTEQAITSLQPQIEGLVSIARTFAESLQGAVDPVALDAFIAKLELAKVSGKSLTDTFKITAKQIDDLISTRSLQAFSTIGEAIGGAIAGQRSWGSAIRDTGRAFLTFAADFIREIAVMTLKTAILKALQNSGWGDSVSGLIGGLVKHEGGLVGAGSGPVRQVSPFMFMGAPKYHTGGIAGLSPNEYPAILQKNEEVLRTDDPRNILNGGGNMPAASPTVQSNVKIMNMIDSASVVSEGLSTQEGERAIINVIRANRTAIKHIVG